MGEKLVDNEGTSGSNPSVDHVSVSGTSVSDSASGSEGVVVHHSTSDNPPALVPNIPVLTQPEDSTVTIS